MGGEQSEMSPDDVDDDQSEDEIRILERREVRTNGTTRLATRGDCHAAATRAATFFEKP